MTNIETLKTPQPGHEDEIGAAVMNVLLLRATQLGRNFMSAEDHRACRLATGVIMQLLPIEPAEHLGRPQTLPKHAPVEVFKAMEKAIAETALAGGPVPVPEGLNAADPTQTTVETVEFGVPKAKLK